MRDRFKDIKFVKSANARPRMNWEKDRTRLLWQKLRSRTVLLPGDVKSVRQAIYRRLRKMQPKLPKSREETCEALDQHEAFSSQDEKMIYINSSETNIVMFSTETNLWFLNESDIHLFGDGTFQYWRYCHKWNKFRLN